MGKRSATKEKDERKLFVKVGECLYRNTSSGTYYALVKRNGKQIRKSLKTQDKTLAQRQLKVFREKVGQLTESPKERRLTFEELGKLWLPVACMEKKASYARQIAYNLEKLNKTFGQHRVVDIDRVMCEQWAVRHGESRAASTFNKDADILKRVLDFGMKRGILLDNPATVIPHRRVIDKRVVIPSHEQFQILVDTVAGGSPRNREAVFLIKLLAYSGMRLGEAVNIVWREIDIDREQFAVSGGEAGTKNHETRIVPLFPSLKRFLIELKQERGEVNSQERILRRKTAKNAIESACKAAGLPHYGHHNMRHYFVSNAVEVGIDFKTIAAWVGHKDGGLLVAKTYGHLRDTHSAAMAKRMDF